MEIYLVNVNFPYKMVHFTLFLELLLGLLFLKNNLKHKAYFGVACSPFHVM